MIHLLFDRTPWFRPKRLGYGATPVTWQGWALTASYLALVVGFSMAMGVDRIARPLWWLALVAATLPFLWIVHRRTEGGWKWRWGE